MIDPGIQKWIAAANSAGLRLSELCTSNGYDIATVRGWLSGKIKPTAEDIEKVNNIIFNVTGQKVTGPTVTAQPTKQNIQQEAKPEAPISAKSEPKQEIKAEPNTSNTISTPKADAAKASFAKPDIEPVQPALPSETKSPRTRKKEDKEMEQNISSQAQTAQIPTNTVPVETSLEPARTRKPRTPKQPAQTSLLDYADTIQQALDGIRAMQASVIPKRLREVMELASAVSDEDLKMVTAILKKCQN